MNKVFQDRRRRGGVSMIALVVLLTLLFPPALAILRLAHALDLRIVFGYIILISAVTYFLYQHDKKSAEAGEWRTPESTLHFVELIGGWPAAFLAQRALRHKISKTSYQVTFWTIIAIHEFASFDFTKDWQYSRKALLFFHQ